MAMEFQPWSPPTTWPVELAESFFKHNRRHAAEAERPRSAQGLLLNERNSENKSQWSDTILSSRDELFQDLFQASFIRFAILVYR